MAKQKGFGVLQVAEQLRQKEDRRQKPVPTWPPAEPLTVLQIRTFPLALLDDLKVLAVRKHQPLAQVAAQVIRAGLKVVNSSGDILVYKPSGEAESG